MTIISTTMDKNLLEEMEQFSESAKELKMSYYSVISIMTESSQFVSKASHSTLQLFKSMLQILMPKKLKLTNSMKIYNIF